MNKVQFKMADHSFSDDVKKGVAEYFKDHAIDKSGNWELYMKAALFVPLAIILYVFVLIGNYSDGMGIFLFIMMGLSFSMIAANVMHDACHGSFSEKKWVNILMGLSMNAIGSNAYLWKIRHTIHHTFTNIDGVDYDIDNWPMLRQSPTQPWKPIHRYQHLYMFPIYALSTIEWMLISDFTKYFTRKITSTVIPKIRLKDHLVFWISKGIGVVAYIVLPIICLGWQGWLTGFLIIHFTMGITLTLIFQLAHLVENTSFEIAGKEVTQIESEWAIHQIMTTSNFAIDNKVLNWFIGGLNFQIEHHLYPNVSHVHYPAISDIIRKECNRHKLPYHCYSTLSEAFLSHVSFMKKLGK